MQEYGKDDAGNCYAVHAKAGEVVIVPPGWVHATINANVEKSLTIGAWCVRDYGFEYKEVREHHGIAFFPIVKDGNITWEINKSYTNASLQVQPAVHYPQFGLEAGVPIYTQFEKDPDRFLFVSKPNLKKKEWEEFHGSKKS